MSEALVGEVLDQRATPATAELSSLAQTINALDRQAVAAVAAGVGRAVQTGAALAAAKAIVGHGHWIMWLSDNCPSVSQQSASLYMRIHEAEQDGRLAQITAGRDLSLKSVVAALQAPGRVQASAGQDDDDDTSSVLDVTTKEPREYDEPGALVGAALRAVVAIEESRAFGLRRQHNLTKALSAAVAASKDNDTWHRNLRALNAFRYASQKVAEKAIE